MDYYGSTGQIKFVDDAIITHTMSPGSFSAGQLFVGRGARNVSQLFYRRENVAYSRGGKFA